MGLGYGATWPSGASTDLGLPGGVGSSCGFGGFQAALGDALAQGTM